jgi:FkbM family methyltransferase
MAPSVAYIHKLHNKLLPQMPTVDEVLNLAWQQHQAGDVCGAEDVYRRVLAQAPESANAWCFLGMACHDQRRLDEAVEAYRHALRIQPEFPIVLSNLGNTLKQQGHPEDAEASCLEAIRIQADYTSAYVNLGIALMAQGRFEDAVARFEQALALKPDDATTYTNLSAAYAGLGGFEKALEYSRRSLELRPDNSDTRKNQGIVELLLEDFDHGWRDYESRWSESDFLFMNRPRWDGSTLAGKTILLHWEQGLGDTIQFIRYASVLRQQGANVIAQIQKPLQKLLSFFLDAKTIAVNDADLPYFDFFLPLLSVPAVLHTSIETIPTPGNASGYLDADPELTSQWKTRLADHPGFRVGIAWQGSPDFYADQTRSIPLSKFKVLAEIDGVRLFSLQKGVGTEQLETQRTSFEVLDFGDELDETAGPFMDSAAIIKNLDLVITSDTSIAHLAGALGVPTWVALSASPDWRWFLNRETSPWYPTMRLFRQSRIGDWDPVFDRIANELSLCVSGQSKTVPVVDSTNEIETPPSDVRLLASGFNVLNKSRHGYMLANRNDIYIGRSIEKYGEFSEGEVTVFRQLLKKADIVVEAGANIGSHTIPLAKLVGTAGMVYAFEPQRIVFQTLCANVALNSLTNVECRNAAIGAQLGEIVVPWVHPDRENNFGGLGLGDYQHGETRDVVTVDSLNLNSCRLLKIDVEGMELEVLKGSAQTIDQVRPFMYIENDRQDRSRELIEHVLSLGYRAFWHLPAMFNSDNFFKCQENIFPRILSINMICVPQELDFEAGELVEITDPNDRWQDLR